MSETFQIILLIIFGVAALLAVLTYFATTREVTQINARLARLEDQSGAGQTEANQKFVTKHECERLHQLVEQKLSGVEANRVDDARGFSASRARIYDEIKALQKWMAEQLATVRVEMGELERRLNSADEARTEKVHDRLNDILAEVSELRGKAK